MTSTGEAVAAAAADDVTLAADAIADMEVADVGSNFADELMTNHERNGDCLLGPGVPFVDMEICPADASCQDPDLHIVDADLRLRHILYPKSPLRMCFDQCLHTTPSSLRDVTKLYVAQRN